MNVKMTNTPKILLIYTGGTIGMIKDSETKALKAFNLYLILEKIPELQQLNCTIESVVFKEPIDSSNMNISYYISLVNIIEENYLNVDGFVVLMGSDTMSYTSSAISFMLENLKKPVVFTGSQLPIGDVRTDAKENLITSIEIASERTNDTPIISEVCLYFDNKLYRANRTTKISADQFTAFTSMNFPVLAESGVYLNYKKHLLYKAKQEKDSLITHKKMVEEVVILKLFPGIPETVITSILNTKGLKGVVLESFGAGNAPNSPFFIKALKQAIVNGIVIINVTQCKKGSVIMGQYNTSVSLQKIGVIDGKDITVEAAVAKLMFLLGQKLSKDKLKAFFEKSLRGEMKE
jgi:L-asparaginase